MIFAAVGCSLEYLRLLASSNRVINGVFVAFVGGNHGIYGYGTICSIGVPLSQDGSSLSGYNESAAPCNDCLLHLHIPLPSI